MQFESNNNVNIYSDSNGWHSIDSLIKKSNLNPIVNKFAIASSKVDNNHVNSIQILDKVYIANGYMHLSETLNVGEAPFATAALYEDSSLLLTNPVTSECGCLLFNNGRLTLVNKALPAGFYYVTGTILNK